MAYDASSNGQGDISDHDRLIRLDERMLYYLKMGDRIVARLELMEKSQANTALILDRLSQGQSNAEKSISDHAQRIDMMERVAPVPASEHQALMGLLNRENALARFMSRLADNSLILGAGVATYVIAHHFGAI